MSESTKIRFLRGRTRPIFLWVLPAIVLALGFWLYFTHSRYVSTDNAYIQEQNSIITPYVSGHVLNLYVKENQYVEKGQLLLDIEADEQHINVQRARSALEIVRTDIEALKATYTLQQAKTDVAKEQSRFARNEYERQKSLADRKLASKSDVDEAQKEYELLQGTALVTSKQLKEIEAKLGGGTDIDTAQHPRVLKAKAELKKAELELARTKLLAPASGIVSQLPNAGDTLIAGVAALSIISDQAPWVEANLKETQLTHIKPGQSVEIKVDAFPGYTWQGHVESIAPATGAEFAILPPQNSSGNWVKVVQRIPVRIAIDKNNNTPSLRAGMSAEISIDLQVADMSNPK